MLQPQAPAERAPGAVKLTCKYLHNACKYLHNACKYLHNACKHLQNACRVRSS